MSSIRYLMKNIGLLTISQFSSRILSFLLVPLYTSVLSTEQYGTYGLYSTTISLLVPILTINLAEAAMRFSLDEKNSKRQIFTICIKYLTAGFLVVCIFVLLNHYYGFISILDQYWYYLLLMYFITAISGLLMSFARGIDKITELAISGFIGTAAVLILNLYFLLVLQWGLDGYFLANLLGTAIQSLYLITSTKVWKYVQFSNTDDDLRKEMISYSWPLVGNSVSWWINDASDRYIVTWLCGVAENGIYSVGYKIPSILSVFQTIFNQAWTLSAVKEYESENYEHFLSKTYSIYNCCMTGMCSLLILFDKPIARILYAKDFYEAWKYVPFLLISIVFGAMSGHLGGVFAAVKNTKAYAMTTIVGACVNVALNIILIKNVGTIGAAIATLVSYVVVWSLRVFYAKRYVDINIKFIKSGFAYSLLLIQAIILLTDFSMLFEICLNTFLFAVVLFLFRQEYTTIYKLIKRIGMNNSQYHISR